MTALYVIMAILILLLMILIHEFGHYIVGKLLKFKINEFSIGFGPKIFSKKSKKTGEVFSVRLLPLGGFCAFEGEDSVEDENKVEETKNLKNIDVFDENASNSVENVENLAETVENKTAGKNNELKSFNDQPPWKRILVLLAGAAFNFLSAIIFAFIFLCVGGSSGVTVVNKYNTKDGVDINERLMIGDRIIKVDGVALDVMNGFSDVIASKNGDKFTFTVIRDNNEVEVVVTKGLVYDEENDRERLCRAREILARPLWLFPIVHFLKSVSD